MDCSSGAGYVSGMKKFAPIVLAALFAMTGRGLAAEKPRPTLSELIGVCGHTVQFKPELYQPVALRVRDYHPMEWDLDKDTSVLPKWPEAKNRVPWDGVYGSWKKTGQDIDACLMCSSLGPKQWKDMPRDAEAYAKSFAAELGSKGRKLVSSAEIGNEPGQYNDEEYRALFTAMAKGLRAGDPALRIATCNITTGKSGSYDKSVTCLKDLDELYDVLTVHIYAQVEPWPTWKRSFPEDPKAPFLSTLSGLIEWRDKNVPKKSVWVTEFGWDCTTKKNKGGDEFAKWQGNTDLQQAQWIVRSFLCFSKLDVERAYIYFFNDNDEPKLHAAAGLTRNFQPKMSYWAVAQMQQVLGHYRFSKVIQEEAGAYVYEYVDAQDARDRVWAAWSPTGANKTTSTTLKLPAGTPWEQITLATERRTTKEPMPGQGPVTLDVSESVTYVKWKSP